MGIEADNKFIKILPKFSPHKGSFRQQWENNRLSASCDALPEKIQYCTWWDFIRLFQWKRFSLDGSRDDCSGGGLQLKCTFMVVPLLRVDATWCYFTFLRPFLLFCWTFKASFIAEFMFQCFYIHFTHTQSGDKFQILIFVSICSKKSRVITSTLPRLCLIKVEWQQSTSPARLNIVRPKHCGDAKQRWSNETFSGSNIGSRRPFSQACHQMHVSWNGWSHCHLA